MNAPYCNVAYYPQLTTLRASELSPCAPPPPPPPPHPLPILHSISLPPSLSHSHASASVLPLADNLPALLLSPSPATQLHVSNALANIQVPSMDPPPHAQLRALLYAARWEGTIPPADFIGDILEGERWLVWAAGSVRIPRTAYLDRITHHIADRSRQRNCLLLYCLDMLHS